jgi:hypothetical protein
MQPIFSKILDANGGNHFCRAKVVGGAYHGVFGTCMTWWEFTRRERDEDRRSCFRHDYGTNYKFGKGKGYIVDRADDNKGAWQPNLDGLRGDKGVNVKRDRNTPVKCATDVTLRIFECKDCTCTTKVNGRAYTQLVKVDT